MAVWRRVRDWGALDARLVLIGEAAGEQEVQRGKPFVGNAGYELAKWWTKCGLRRSMFRIMNVVPYRPSKKSNNFKLFSKTEVAMWADNLHERIDALIDPWIICPAGQYALRACLRQDLFHQNSAKIDDWRGSMIEYVSNSGRRIKMIPMIHPSRTFYEKALVRLCEEDWLKISIEMHTRVIRTRKRTVYLDDVPQYRRYLHEARHKHTVMSIDIETRPSAREIVCVGFSYDPDHALVLSWNPPNIPRIKALCESACRKVLQNGYSYDAFWLDPPDFVKGAPHIKINNYYYDDLAMDHAVDPILPHDLATQGSRYTLQPFWKRDRGKESDSTPMYKLDTSTPSKLHAVMRYCGIDNCIQRELVDIHLSRLRGEEVNWATLFRNIRERKAA